MQAIKLLAAASAAALLFSASAEARDHRHYRHHSHGNGAAVGAALGAGIFLGALAGTAAANAREPVYAAPPPPPVPEYRAYRDRGEEASAAIDACRRGLLDAARQYGAYDAEVGDIFSVNETEFGHRVRAEVTIDYPDYSRTSVVTCRTEDGLLVSARSDY